MGKIIVLTAGHSNTDPGAVNGSDREADIRVCVQASRAWPPPNGRRGNLGTGVKND